MWGCKFTNFMEVILLYYRYYKIHSCQPGTVGKLTCHSCDQQRATVSKQVNHVLTNHHN